MNPVLRTATAAVLRGLLPYPDPVRRWRVRKRARKLVVCEPWPADDAITSSDLSQLALLRLLWLQKQTRRAVRGRHREAAVLLARSSLEACILGLYCLHTPDAVDRLREAHFKAGSKLLAFLDTAGVIPRDVIKQAVAALGSQAEGPTVKAMAMRIDAETGASVVVDLYDRLYVSTSTYFVHANAASLLRHVKANQNLADRPMIPWVRRSPVRLADACVGLLAAAIVHHNARPNALFVTYAEAHYARTMTPMLVMAGKGLRSFKPVKILEAVRMATDLRRYLDGPALSDPPEVRDARVRAAFNGIFVGQDVPVEALQPVADYLAEKIIAGWFAPPTSGALGESANDGSGGC